jgi:hypothetical protein
VATLVTIANICRRGHVISVQAPADTKGFCADCGADVLGRCPSCGQPILGVPAEADAYGTLDYDGSYEPPRFCQKCGAAFPWLDRQGRIYELQNLLDREPVDEATRLTVREQLEALTDPGLTEEEQLKRWQRVRGLAPELFKTGRSIIEGLATAYMKKELEL